MKGMFDWLSGEKRRAKEARERVERDARLRAELAVKARQFDEENGHQFREETSLTSAPSLKEAPPPTIHREEVEVLVAPNGQKFKADSTVTIHDYSARTSFNF